MVKDAARPRLSTDNFLDLLGETETKQVNLFFQVLAQLSLTVLLCDIS